MDFVKRLEGWPSKEVVAPKSQANGIFLWLKFSSFLTSNKIERFETGSNGYP
jgi:hypothetical protein